MPNNHNNISITFLGHCNGGVDGVQCEKCKPLHYGFSPQGCKLCDCDPTGSLKPQCDLITGECECYAKVWQKNRYHIRPNRRHIKVNALQDFLPNVIRGYLDDNYCVSD